jgi:hypothetical protein
MLSLSLKPEKWISSSCKLWERKNKSPIYKLGRHYSGNGGGFLHNKCVFFSRITWHGLLSSEGKANYLKITYYTYLHLQSCKVFSLSMIFTFSPWMDWGHPFQFHIIFVYIFSSFRWNCNFCKLVWCNWLFKWWSARVRVVRCLAFGLNMISCKWATASQKYIKWNTAIRQWCLCKCILFLAVICLWFILVTVH